MQVTADRKLAVDAVDVLNDFIGDLITGVMVLREYLAQHQQGKLQLVQLVPVQKMCLSHLVLALAKFDEFWQHYHNLVPQEHRDACKLILKKLKARKVVEFRNRCVGHIWDNERKRPLEHSEVMNALADIVVPNLAEFLNWINDPKANTYPLTVVSVIEVVRNSLMVAHKILPHEFVGR